MTFCKIAFAIMLLFVASLVTWVPGVAAQVESPDRKHIFREDARIFKKQNKVRQKAILSVDPANSSDVDVKAAEVSFEKESNLINASGGVLLSRSGVQVQADQAIVNPDTKDAKLSGEVVLNDVNGSLLAESGDFNFDSELGDFKAAQFSLEDGAYKIVAQDAKKLSEFEYELSKSELSTCQCLDGNLPWTLHSSRAHITQEGYAHTYNTWMEFQGVPIFYTPYLSFPVKSKRQSGLMAPEFGYGKRDGFQFKQPIYIAPNDSSDFMVSPFVETNTRVGTSFDYRQNFSRYNKVEGRLVYSNDSLRGGDLRGTITSDVFDPTFKENRVGLMYNQIWSSAPEENQAWAMIADVHYVNDDLFLRELEDSKIGNYNDRYATSTLVARSNIGDYALAEVLTEYNESLVSNDDLTFQRLPEMTLTGARSLRPFGFNPYGIKLVPRATLNAVNFSRQEGYDGWRFDAAPGMSMPFHLSNYFNGRFDVVSNQTWYNLSDNSLPGSANEIDSTADRQAYSFRYTMGTGVERIYELQDGNWLSWLTALGQNNQDNRLVRLKHTIEPQVAYSLVPDTASADGLPLFDSSDRIRPRSLVTYGIRSNLYGRFQPRRAVANSIAELSPRPEDVPLANASTALSDFGVDDSLDLGVGDITIKKGEIRPLVSFGVKQAYDYEEDQHDSKVSDPKNDLSRTAFSDINSDLTLFPTSNFAFRFENNFNQTSKQFSSWALSAHLTDDRGDAIRGRYTYINDALSHIEGNAEVEIADRMKLGFYARYDDREHAFLERRAGLRLESSCNCWKLDLGVSEKINPDRQEFGLIMTFNGLGDLAQKFGLGGK